MKRGALLGDVNMDLNTKKPHHKMEPCHNMMYVYYYYVDTQSKPPTKTFSSILVDYENSFSSKLLQ